MNQHSGSNYIKLVENHAIVMKSVVSDMLRWIRYDYVMRYDFAKYKRCQFDGVLCSVLLILYDESASITTQC